MRRTIFLLILLIQPLTIHFVFAQIHYVKKGAIQLGINVTKDGRSFPIDSLSDGFEPGTQIPINLVIPEGSSLGIAPDSIGAIDIALVINNSVPKYIHSPEKKMTGFGLSTSPGSENRYSFIDETNGDTLEIRWKVGFNPIELSDLFPASYFQKYVAIQFNYLFESYPDTSQYDWVSKEFIQEVDARGIPKNPSFPYSENGLYFVIDQLTEDAQVQLIGYHDAPQSFDSENPFALFLYENLDPGKYELVVWPFKDAPDSLALRYPFEIQNPWWKTSAALVGFSFLGALMLSMFFFLYYRAANLRKTKELEWEKQLTEAELKAIRAQLNPHFLFNALNSIQNLVSQGKNELASNYIQKLSKFLRKVLTISEKQFHELEEEIELTKLYLELEKLRYPFSVEITVSEEIPQGLLVPVMLFQPYVENAVKHGVASKGENGKISLRIEKKNEFLVIDILDNGPGLAKSYDSSVGLKLGDFRIRNLNHFYSGEASITITNQSNHSGVLVRISLPYEL